MEIQTRSNMENDLSMGVLAGMRETSLEDRKSHFEDCTTMPSSYISMSINASTAKVFRQEALSFDLELSLEGDPFTHDFVSREDDMKVMEDYFFHEAGLQGQKVFTLHGLGGMGKTQLALGFAHAFRSNFWSIFFMNGASRDTIRQSISSALDRIWDIWPPGSKGRPSTKPVSLKEILETTLKWFDIQENKKWLIIYDNIDHEGESSDMKLEEYLPKMDHGAILITSRLKPSSRKGKSHELTQMNISESSTLLDKAINSKLPTFDEASSGTNISADAVRDKRELLRILDGLPLALAQAGSLISDSGMTIGKFLEHYRASRVDVLSMLPSVGDNESDPKSSILTTWKVSLDQLLNCQSTDLRKRKLYANAVKLLFLFGQLDSRDIWYSLIERGLLDPDAPEWFKEVAGNELSFFNTVRVLIRNSFVTADRSTGIYSMHNIFHDYCQDYTEQQQNKEFLHLAISIVGYSKPSEFHRDSWKLKRRLMPHANAILPRIKSGLDFDITGLDNRNLEEIQIRRIRQWLRVPGVDDIMDVMLHPLCSLADLYETEDKHQEALDILNAALQRSEHSHGPDDPYTLIFARELSWIYFCEDDAEKADHYSNRALVGLRKTLGPTSTDAMIATTCVMLATWLKGNQTEAIQQADEIIERYVELLGPNDFCTLRAMRNQASNYRDMGDKEKAGTLLKDVLQRFESVLGKSHPSTLDVAVNLARVSEPEDSAVFMERVWNGFKACYGVDHPKTLAQAEELADDYESYGKLDDCQRIRLDIVDTYRKRVPPNNTRLADSLLRLADAYIVNKMNALAMEALDEAFELLHSFQGDIPEDVHGLVDLRHDLGLAYKRVGKAVEAGSLLEISLTWYDSNLEEPDIQIIRTLDNLSGLYAENSYGSSTRLLAILERLVSLLCREDVRDKHDAMKRLIQAAAKYKDLGQYQHASTLFQKAYEYFAHEDGEKSYHAVLSGYLFGSCFYKLRDFAKAKPILEKVARLEDVVDEDCRAFTMDALQDLGLICRDEGDLRAAERNLAKSLKGYRELHVKWSILVPAIVELGNAYYYLHEFPKAKDLLLEAMEIIPTIPKTKQYLYLELSSTCLLGLIARTENDFEKAETLLKEGLAGFEQNFEPYYAPTVTTLRSLAETYALQMKLPEAALTYRRLHSAHTAIRKPEVDAGSAFRYENKRLEIMIWSSIIHTLLGHLGEANEGLNQVRKEFAEAIKTYKDYGDCNRIIARERAVDHAILQIVAEMDASKDISTNESTLESFSTLWGLKLESEDLVLYSLEPTEADHIRHTFRYTPLSRLETFLPYAPGVTPDVALGVWTENGYQGLPDHESAQDEENTLVTSGKQGRTTPFCDVHLLRDNEPELLDDNWRSLLPKLPKELKMNIEYNGNSLRSWTYMPNPISPSIEVPLYIAGAPVITPVRYDYPPTAGIGSLPDPYPHLIDPTEPLTIGTIAEIFDEYEFAEGFFLLLNGLLQIIVPDEFDYNAALSDKPNRFGGLKVSYIPMNFEPTADVAAVSSSSPSVTKAETSRSFVSLPIRRSRHSLHQSETTDISSLHVGDIIEARARRLNKRTRRTGRVGLKIKGETGKSYLTAPTHLLLSVLEPSKSHGPFSSLRQTSSSWSNNWMENVHVYAHGEKIGKVVESFDPEPGQYPDGYKYDLSLIELTHEKLTEKICSPVAELGWLSQKGWDSLRKRPGNLKILGNMNQASIEQSLQGIPSFFSRDYLVVGEGVVRISDRSQRLKRPPTQKDVDYWGQVVSRLVLYRVFPNFDNPRNCSGAVLYADGIREDGTEGPGVVGFQSFVQDNASIQYPEMEGQEFEEHMRAGLVAFYGAFQVAEEVRKKHHVVSTK